MKSYSKTIAIIRELVKTEFKLRYQRSILGYAWSLFRPMTNFAILYLVFTTIFPLGREIENFPVYLLSGIVLWNFFTESTVVGMSSLVARGDMIRKIAIPKYTIVISSVIAALVNLFFNLIVLMFLILLTTNFKFSLAILTIPYYFLILLVFTIAVSLILASLFVKYRDVGHIWEVFLQALFYLTPIIYPLTLIHKQLFREVISISPIAYSIQNIREILITPQTITAREVMHFGDILPLIITVIVTIIGLTLFKKMAKSFAEEI